MMNLFNDLKTKNEKISVIGLGYVGLPLAIELAKKYNVIGFDLNSKKVNKYLNGIDVTNEVGTKALKESDIIFTDQESELKDCKFHIVAVPTPINTDKTPNLNPVIEASKIVGRNLLKGSVIVYESTVYPGTTEEICIPILEKESGLLFGIDFKVGYSPERINPGDKINVLTKIIKVVSGSDDEALDIISQVYGSIIDAGVHKAESIKVAEASKVIENAQRDINIAFMNELSIIFNRMDIATSDVLAAASTKWNFMDFKPGLVGGHCIGVDPYYFTYKAEQLGYHSQIILSGRKINDDMGNYVASNIIKQIIKSGKAVKDSKVGILGITFKENCADVRNTKVIDIINELKEYGVEVIIHDPVANEINVKEEYGINLADKSEFNNLDCVVLAVAHDEFKNSYNLETINNLFKDETKVLIDIKSLFNKKDCELKGYLYWSL